MGRVDILNTVRARFEHNQNWLCIIVGDTGSGKSWTAIKIGSCLDPNFVANNVAFNTQELIHLIKTLPQKSLIVMDEAGVSYGSRESMSRQNVVMSKIFQAFRFKQIALIWTLPDTHQIDINARRLLHSYLETLPIDYEHGRSRVKWFNVRVDRWNAKIYTVYPRIRTSSGVKTITSVRFAKPPQDIIEAYEKKKQEAFCRLIDSCEVDGEAKSKKYQEAKLAVERAAIPSFRQSFNAAEDVIELEVL